MKSTLAILLIATGIVFAAGSAAAAEDFSRYTNEQLSAMRHSMHDAPLERRTSYRQEIRNRFGVWIDIDMHPNHLEHFWDDMDDHHSRGGYGAGHHGGTQREYHNSDYHRTGGGGGC